MRTFDLSPLFRSTIGFDRLSRLLDAAQDQSASYPPYNIEKTGENAYQISMAVAGFSPDELTITVQDRSLVVKGKSAIEEGERAYLHRGIATRAFERRFDLADDIQVGEAKLEHGMLHVALERVVPEEKKPRTIQIRNGEAAERVIEQKAA
ncbi:MAG: Hsp20 family protein [Alphaproteobacteria bacterium]